jgi:protein-disulfide isomerase
MCEDPSIIDKPETLSPPIDLEGYKSFGNPDAKVKFIMFGCYTCQYTKEVWPDVKKVYEEYQDKVQFVFIDFPVSHHGLSVESSVAVNCIYKQHPDLFIEYSDILFTTDLRNTNDLKLITKEIDIDYDEFSSCLEGEEYTTFINQSILLGKEVGIYGTPTIFINDEVIVGPRTYRAFKKVIDDELKRQ